ncbi:MAG: NUDIX hydrolase [Patescibacteria group bacterium]|jgi:8-oxo-dGTP pyrophosphatase MutT (NUDIX family)
MVQPKVRPQGSFALETVDINGRNWSVLHASDSAGLLVFLKDRNAIVLVRQQRAPMVSAHNPEGSITELLAGRFDKDETPIQLLVREASEEAGIAIDASQIKVLNFGHPLALSAGIIDELCWIGYVEISDDQIDPSGKLYGLHEEGEFIDRIMIPVEQLESLVCEDARVFGMIQWFLRWQMEHRLQALTDQLEKFEREMNETKTI